ncbi:MAG: hypothetical protein M1823_000719 [Watsoniomyces obsoletus]|nr:MAG: hypothetical protein M1823_000719 [Watsoniomyces obsoletus]
MVYSLSYRRPARISQATSTHWSFEEREKYVEESIRSGSTGNTFAGIPDALSFDRIVSGGTCPPCTLREFMDYLAHIELAAENLQFYLWYRDYCRRFAETPASEKALAPEWTDAHMAGENDHVPPPAKTQTKLSPETLDMLEKTKIEVSTLETGADGMLPPPSAGYGSESDGQTITGPWEYHRASTQASSSYQQKAASAFESADVPYQPFTIQPFRDEINRVIATYIVEGAPRELNLSSRERATVLRGLGYTTHPSAFRTIATTVECALRQQAHPNFIRWTICNGNRPRVLFARGLGVTTIALGFLTAILLTLSSAGRGWRALAALGWFIGVATLAAAWKGMCVQ